MAAEDTVWIEKEQNLQKLRVGWSLCMGAEIAGGRGGGGGATGLPAEQLRLFSPQAAPGG